MSSENQNQLVESIRDLLGAVTGLVQTLTELSARVAILQRCIDDLDARVAKLETKGEGGGK